MYMMYASHKNQKQSPVCVNLAHWIELNPLVMLTTSLNGDGTNEIEPADRCK